MRATVLLLLGLFSVCSGAVPPKWSKNPMSFQAYIGIPFLFNLENNVQDIDSKKFMFRVTGGAPTWTSVDRFFGDLEGTPGPSAIGLHRFSVEVSDDAGVNWVQGAVELEVFPAPSLTCPDGSKANSLGVTPGKEYELFSCPLSHGS